MALKETDQRPLSQLKLGCDVLGGRREAAGTYGVVPGPWDMAGA